MPPIEETIGVLIYDLISLRLEDAIEETLKDQGVQASLDTHAELAMDRYVETMALDGVVKSTVKEQLATDSGRLILEHLKARDSYHEDLDSCVHDVEMLRLTVVKLTEHICQLSDTPSGLVTNTTSQDTDKGNLLEQT